MEEVFREYGEVIVDGIVVAVVLAVIGGLFFGNSVLGSLVSMVGNSAC